MDLAQILLQGRLIRHLEDVCQMVSLHGLDALVVVAVEEHVPGKRGSIDRILRPPCVRLSLAMRHRGPTGAPIG